ncbi:MAG TPA: hypothetical protein VH583_07000 [Vicinamibacterales bacterium]|jgi:hypothetical protein
MLLRAYIVLSSLTLVALCTAAFRQARPQNLGEINVERINVIDRDGTLRLVLADKDRMHPGVVNGVTIDRARPTAGLIFFNDEGDEVGGLTYTGSIRNGERNASGSLTFDQLKQDQTVGLRYIEEHGKRSAGLEVWDRSDAPISDLIEQLNAANTIADPVAREEAVKAVRAKAPPPPRRVFVGKDTDRSAAIALADAAGNPRLKLIVEGDGQARIEFLDGHGKVTRRVLPE